MPGTSRNDLLSLRALPSELLSINQIEAVYKHVEDIIDNLDEYAIKELMSGYSDDVDTLLNVLIDETKDAFFSNKGPIKTNSFNYLDKLTDNFDLELKKKSFNYFVMSVLPDFEMNYHHVEWGNLIQFYKWLCVIAARDHSKSFTFSFAYPIWKLFRYEREGFGLASRENALNKHGMIITNEHSLARDFLKLITEEIENNPILRERLYPNKSESWGKETITTKWGAELKVKGAGSALRGRHPGWIVIDDFLDDSCLYSNSQRDIFINLFHSVIMNMIVPGGQVCVVGTPYHEADLYANLKKAKNWRVFEYPAILPDGSLLWENRHNLKSLLDKRHSQGSIIFSREILVKPITSESSIFPWSVLEKSFIGMNDFCLVDNIHSFPRRFKKVVLGCDFAISANVAADDSVFTTVGIDELDNYWVLNITEMHGASYNAQIAKIKELDRNFRYNTIMMENNAFQAVMLQLAKDAGLKNVVAHNTGVNKFDLKTGLPGLATVFEAGRIKMPRGDERSKGLTDKACLQANSISWDADKKTLANTAKHDDMLFSLWLAIKAGSYVTQNFGFGFL